VSWRWKASWSCERRHSSRGDVGSRASVGPFASRVSPREVGRADDSGCPKLAEEGNVSFACAPKRMHRRTHERSSLAHGRTRPSLGPSTRAASSRESENGTIRHHGWANPRKWEEPALGSVGRTQRGSPRVDAPLKGSRSTRQKRKEVEASVPARIKSPKVGLPARRVSVAEVGRRRLASNKLGTRALKRAVRVE
jgi:hypothetical protein